MQASPYSMCPFLNVMERSSWSVLSGEGGRLTASMRQPDWVSRPRGFAIETTDVARLSRKGEHVRERVGGYAKEFGA
jgi:hypothetical protein